MSNRALTPVNVPWAAADPAGPNLHAGDLYGNSGTGKLRLYSGTAWADVAAAGGAGTPATTVQTESGLDFGQVGTSTNYAREDHRHPITNLVDFSSTQTISGIKTFSGGLVVPAGQALTTGTRSVVTGTRATTTNASDTVDLGTFSTTGGAIELRIHAHLAAPASGGTASVTKVYEVAAGSIMGTVSTWYLCLPADASANAAATNDFALEVQRTAVGTFQFRFRQKSIGVAGSIAFVAETLGDTVVAFTPSTTVTSAPAAVSTPHPSNAFTAAAGNVGIGTDAPTSLLHVNGTLNATQVQDSGSRVYSAANPPPYPVVTVAGRAGAVTLTAADVASGTFPGTYTVTGALAIGGTLSGAGVETLEYGLRAGFAISGGGTQNFDFSNNFSWSARFVVIGAGNSASSSTNGYFDIVMPTSGAIAVAGGASARNWSASGVLINIWEALWYRLPIGSGNTTVPGNYLITNYTSAMTPPSADYVLIAARNGDDGYLKTCTGRFLVTGQSVIAGIAVFTVAGRTGPVTLTAADIQSGTFQSGTYNVPGTLQENGARVYSAGNPPPYPVTTVAGLTGAVATGRGYVGHVNLTANYAPAAATTSRVAASGDTVTLVAGRRYCATIRMVASLAAASTTAAASAYLYLNSVSIAQGGTPAGTLMASVGVPVGVQTNFGVASTVEVEFTCAASGGDITPGNYVLILGAQANQATTVTTWFGAATPSNRCSAFIEDIGT